MRKTLQALALGLALATGALPPAAQAHSTASEASALSMLPVAVSVAAPAMLLSTGAVLTVVAVEASATGTVWVLERASDGVRATVHWGSHAAGAVSVAVGTGVLVTAMSTGWVLSAAGRALAIIPNELGASLLYSERITR